MSFYLGKHSLENLRGVHRQAQVQFKSWSQWWKHCKIRLSH